MANTFTLQSKSYDGRYMKLTCSQTQNISKNTSTISWKLETIGGNVNYYYTGPTTLKINGVEAYYKKRTGAHEFPCAKGSTSGTVTVVHDADGKKNISVSLSTAIYTSTVSTKSDTWSLDTIPRSATLLTATNFNDEQNPTITYSNPAGNNVTTLQTYIYANDEKTVLVGAKNLTKTSTSFTYSLTDAERATLRKAATSNTLKVKFRIKTVIGGVTYWSVWLPKTMTIVNANPVATMTVIDNNPDTVKLTGNINSIIMGYSTALYTISATAQKEATISSYSVTNGSQTATGSSGSFLNATNNVFEYTVTDSRGNKTTDTVMKTLVDYVELTVNQKVQMTLVGETGATMTVNVGGSYFNDSFGAVDNTLSVSYQMKTGTGDYGDWVPVDVSPIGNTYSASFTIDGLNYEETYTIQVKAEDKLNKKDTTPYVAKLKPIFDWSENDFNFNCEIKVNNVPLINTIVDTIYPVGSIYMSANLVDPSVIFGGTWERIQDRFLLAASDTYDAGTEDGKSEVTLTEQNLPSHSHKATSKYTGGSLLLRGPADANHNIVDASLGGNNITKTTYSGSAWGNSISTTTTDRAPEQINIGGTVTTNIGSTGSGTPIKIMPPYLAVYMWKRTS